MDYDGGEEWHSFFNTTSSTVRAFRRSQLPKQVVKIEIIGTNEITVTVANPP